MGKHILLLPLLFGFTIVLIGCEERGRQPRIGTPNPSIHRLQRLNASMETPIKKRSSGEIKTIAMKIRRS